MHILSRITEFLGLKRSVVGLLTMVILVGMGEKMAERFLPIYLLALGASPFIPGALNALDNLLSALYSFPGGWLSDKLGYKNSLALFNIVALFGYAIVILVPHWLAVIAGSFLFLSWTALSLPATMSLVNTVLPASKRTMGVSMHSLIRRIPMALGPIVGGILIDRFGRTEGVRIAFMVAFAFGLIALVGQQLLISESPRQGAKADIGMWKALTTFPTSLKTLLISDILVRFCEQIPYAYIAIWAMDNTKGAKVSASSFGILTAIEMVVALLIYIPVAWLADKGNKKIFVVITFFNFTMFPVFLYYSRSFSMLIVAFVIRGLKEFGEPTRKSLILDLAPEESKATSFGAYYLARDILVSAGALGGAYLWDISPAVNLFAATGFGLVGTLFFAWRGKDLSQKTASV